MTRTKMLQEEAERKIKSIYLRTDISQDEKNVLSMKVWENYNDTVRKTNKGEY